ncbi:MAG: prepilin-type N-terminal cleavage/methylation domain-containing protein [Nitrospira sp.]|nr:prepilin-type N-terminal cleavage/methylation domain-containing protein [Nitrospira sp.]
MTTERPDKGFTLMEVLISLTLMTVVLGAVYSTFFSVHRAMERFETISLKYHEARTSLDIMRREIEGAVLKKAREKDGDPNKTSFNIRDRDIFGKKASALDLTAFSFRGGMVDTISYFVSEKEGKLELVKSVTPAIIGRGDYRIGMIEDIEGFNVEILFNNKWVGTWASSDTGKLPDIIRMSIEFDDNGKKVILTEYARPRVGKGL